MTTASARRTGGQAEGGIDRQPENDQSVTPELGEASDAGSARIALCTFLAGFGIGAGRGRDLLVEQLLKAVDVRRCDEPHASLAERAIMHAEHEFEIWLTSVLGAEKLADQPALPVGRAAFLACGGPTAWPDLFLRGGLPEGFVAAMRAAAPLLLPAATPGTMEAQSLEGWSIADARRAAAEMLDTNLAWLAHARPLITAPMKLTRPTS